MKGTRVPSGRSATASAPRTARPSLSATAIGHWSCGSGVPSGMEQFPGDAPFVAAERGRPAGEFDRRLVEVGNFALRVGRVNRGRYSREQFGETLLALAELAFGFLAIGDVAGDLRCADDAPRAVAHRRDGQRNVQETAVLPPANGLIMVDTLAAPYAREDPGLLVFEAWRKKNGHGLADGLTGAIAEQPLGARIPGLDDPVQILADDRIVGGFHDGHELLRTLFGGAPRLFRPQPRDAEAELPRKRQRDVDLRFGEVMRPVVIGHEFSGKPAADQDRNESNRCDMFSRNRFLEGIRKSGNANVLEIDRTRISFVPVPWRMAFDGLPVAVRQAPPSDETHHVAVIKQQNGGALAGERRERWRPGRRRKRLAVTRRIAAFRRTGTAPPALRCGAPAPVRLACGR